MADLIAAARKQIEYASNVLGGRFANAQDHLDKADAFLVRAAAADAHPLVRAAIAPEPTTTPDWSGTAEEAWSRYLDGADELLKAQGKPYGRDGAERGSLTRDEQIKLATDLGVLDELTASCGGVNPFGPEPEPGTIA